MNVIDNFYSYINKEISSESESKELTVLLRIQTLADLVYTFLLAILFSTSFDVVSGFITLIFAVAYLALFNLSYRLSSKFLLSTYAILISAQTLFCCMYISPGLGFRYVIFTLIPLIYFKADETMSFRISRCIFVGVFSIALALVGMFVKSPWNIPHATQIIIVCIATFFLTAKLMIISHFYYKKFAADETKIIRYSQKLEKLATQDPLTKLQNRRGMETYLTKKIREQSENGMFCIVMGDIDFFKKINDTYGHEAGDYVLVTISNIMADFIKDKGHLARWGGEEFLLVFESVNGDLAFVETEKLKRIIEKTNLTYNSTPINVTMTFGLEEYSPQLTLEENIKKADDKLYIGKTSGRNRVIY